MSMVSGLVQMVSQVDGGTGLWSGRSGECGQLGSGRHRSRYRSLPAMYPMMDTGVTVCLVCHLGPSRLLHHVDHVRPRLGLVRVRPIRVHMGQCHAWGCTSAGTRDAWYHSGPNPWLYDRVCWYLPVHRMGPRLRRLGSTSTWYIVERELVLRLGAASSSRPARVW